MIKYDTRKKIPSSYELMLLVAIQKNSIKWHFASIQNVVIGEATNVNKIVYIHPLLAGGES